jgi:Leucine-rich repeat (LRR) protein
LLETETDDRFKYLLKHGNIHYIESETSTIYVELPHIPGKMIVYRKPDQRDTNPEHIILEHKGLKEIPLLEGEERLKFLNLQRNQIESIDNLVSLPNLTMINMGRNKITSIDGFSLFEASLTNLKILILSNNFLSSVTSINS